ncbi:uncharacterized protein LOC116108842 isoform X1 [Pistacia vera]|uniref:uncharacterized protein LOC116108842 isoform X1 n=1 Tax=Pistacia vera TaxID=55513 RepID=UPI00126336CD|nr:uncharacterized protein LOC116108842 isoform X1 [Pistacia vera]
MRANPYHSHLLSSTQLQTPSLMALHGLKQVSPYFKAHNLSLSAKLNGVVQNAKPNICCAINMASGQSRDPERFNLGSIMIKARKLWDSCPQPVKSFPWNRALQNFVQLILDLFLAVVKYLIVPLLGVSCLSEMSYCAHEKKLFFVPVPLLIGMVIADILRETTLEISPLLKDAEVPWHLIAIAIFFTLLKLPGPYYPYWGRIFIPHFANGVLLRTLWFAFLWYRKPQKASETKQPNTTQ